MVIQSTMSSKSIVEVWEMTATIFEKNNIPLNYKAMETFIEADNLINLLVELNNNVGSSNATCIEGG